MGLFSSKKKRAANLMAEGAKAVGTITSVQDTGMTVNDNPRVKMTFRIEPLDGAPAFDASKTTTVSRVQIPQAGQRYPVWYSLEDPNEFAFATIADPSGRAQIVELFGPEAFGPDGSGIGLPAMSAPAAHAATDGGTAAADDDPVAKLERLAALHASGALTDAEFAAQKAKLL
jgi:hypothetical protein